VLTGPLKAQDDLAVRRYRAVFDTWRLVDFSADIAESAARLRASLGLKIADAIQIASALAINADAVVTHDRDFGRVRALRVLS
jgi:predicted nucleic acid-binding protein